MKKILQSKFLLPIGLLLIAGLVYAPFIRDVGFYWDDFPYVFFGHVLGTTQYHHVFYDERPFLPILYNLTAPLLGDHVLAWQIFAILMRWVCALTVDWIVRLTWPAKKKFAFVVALLFLVYPGFSQQWISTIYSRVFILLLLFLLSLAFMLKAQRSPRLYWLFTGISVISAGLSLLGSEYFFGLEFARPVILWILFTEQGEPLVKRAKKVLLHWLPYLLGVLSFTVWRGLLVQSSLYRIQISGDGNFAAMALNLVASLATNAFKGGLLAWLQLIKLPQIVQRNLVLILVMIGFALFAAGLTAWLSIRGLREYVKESGPEPSQKTWSFQVLSLGLVMLLAGSLPVWAAKLPFDLAFPYNRFTLAMMFGSALIIGWLLSLVRRKEMAVGLLSLLVGMTACWHFQIANTYRQDWEKLGSVLQQLTWRAPGIQAGTMLVAYELPFEYYSDNSLTAAINWTYAPDFHSGNLPYVLDYLTVRQNSVLKTLEPDILISQKYRSLEFKGNTSDMLVIHLREGSCLRILDQKFTGVGAIPQLKDTLPAAIALSNLGRIIPAPESPALPVPQFFPPGEAHSWCYFFEKADLARQTGDFDAITLLWKAALEVGVAPEDISEYQPFVEGLALTGNLDDAVLLANAMVAKKPSSRQGLCQIWGRIEENGSFGEADLILLHDLQKEMRCQ